MALNLEGTFFYERRVAFSDTDAMAVVHHANYLRYFEETRVAWMRERQLSAVHYPQNEHVLAVLNYQVWHRRPARFDDLLRVHLQVQRKGLRIGFEYLVMKDEERMAEGETWHVPVDSELRVVRPDPKLLQQLEKEPWTETWLSNS